MSEQPHLSTLPQRMRYAADVLDEVDKTFGAPSSWYAGDLRGTATLWQIQDRAGAAVEELAAELWMCVHGERWVSGVLPLSYTERARKLIESGWRKGDPE